jgi:hypothetical protein
MFEGFINEANELIKAQGDCKAAIFQIQKELDKLLNDMMKGNYISSFKTVVEPYNQGYELKMKVDSRELWKKDLNPQEEAVGNFLNANSYVHLQPGSFFQGNYEEGKGAYIEGAAFELVRGKREYPKYDIKGKADITKATKDFIKLVSDQIADVRKKAGL